MVDSWGARCSYSALLNSHVRELNGRVLHMKIPQRNTINTRKLAGGNSQVCDIEEVIDKWWYRVRSSPAPHKPPKNLVGIRTLHHALTKSSTAQ
ncbi:hypothetical protein RRG08_060200 [Elysia crispata]|uniref:Uncharacterized protein n=1 Tax=Elysia crispata TaxID=231223 RepID=A0AAE1DPN5_9GAST|nr:hypothetical protein RRG08_060200 [Elysia crispata]